MWRSLTSRWRLGSTPATAGRTSTTRQPISSSILYLECMFWSWFKTERLGSRYDVLCRIKKKPRDISSIFSGHLLGLYNTRTGAWKSICKYPPLGIKPTKSANWCQAQYGHWPELRCTHAGVNLWLGDMFNCTWTCRWMLPRYLPFFPNVTI